MLVLLNDMITLKCNVVVGGSTDDTGITSYSQALGYTISGSPCLEFVSQDPVKHPSVPQEIGTTFKAVKTGMCTVNFFVYVVGFPVTTGVLVNTFDLKIVETLKKESYNIQIIVIILLAVIGFAVMHYILSKLTNDSLLPLTE